MPTKAKAAPAPPPAVSIRKPVLVCDVDWGNIPVPEAQGLYAQLRAFADKAAAVLNARTTRTDGKWICYMAGKTGCCIAGVVHDGAERPRFTDYARTDKNGLLVVVKICSELCSIRYNQLLIDERREKYAPKRGE
jgi:hypothetical protein